MINVMRMNRGWVICTAGLLAIFLAGGTAWAGGSKGTKGSQSSKGSKGNKGSKGKCFTNADCADGFFCKTKDNKCKKKDKNYCASDADCSDGLFCKLKDNKCKKKDKNYCASDADCKDGYICRADDSKCHKDKDKDDDGSCATASDCEDGEVCGVDGKCHEDDSCDDSDPCTIDTVTDGVCGHTADPTCEPVAPQAAEVCGNCIDDNNDGLTDFEDPSCCSNSIFTMNLVKAKLLTKKSGTKLRLRSALLPPTLTGVNLLEHDVFLQIRAASGSDVFCARVPAKNFKRIKKTLRFRGGKASASGIKRVAVMFRKRGYARVQVLGKQMPMTHLQKGPMQITIGFYNADLGNEETRCASTMASFRSSKRSALVAP